MTRRRDWNAVGFAALLLTPGLLLYGLLVLWPMEQAFWVALHRWRGLSGRMTFVGLENFVAMAGDEKLRVALGHNLQFFLLSLCLVLPAAIWFANTLSGEIRGGEFFRALYLFPNVVSIVAVSTLWMFIYNPNWGLLNASLKAVGLGGAVTTWLADPRTVLPAVCVSYAWYALGFYILLFRGGIQGISTEILEAAAVDGATGSQVFARVVLPLLADFVRLSVIYLFINALNVFSLVWIMAPPSGTAGATEVSLTFLFQKGFIEQQFGYATAIGGVTFLLVLGLTSGVNRLWKVG